MCSRSNVHGPSRGDKRFTCCAAGLTGYIKPLLGAIVPGTPHLNFLRFREKHACFSRNTHASGKDMRVFPGTCMVSKKTCVFFQEHAWFRKRHACFSRNTHGSGKDMRVFRGTRMVPEKTCVFFEEHAWF